MAESRGMEDDAKMDWRGLPGEWLIADGLGGYVMGSFDGIRRRRYHALLLVASPTDERRFVLAADLLADFAVRRDRRGNRDGAAA